MRDINFKAKIRGIDKPLHVLLIDFGNCVICVIDEDRGTQLTYDWHMVEGLLEYIGLKDKNGKKIYEGDIVKKADGNIFHGGAYIDIVKYEGGGFSPFAVPAWEVTEYGEGVIVIGNIYENKGLLK